MERCPLPAEDTCGGGVGQVSCHTHQLRDRGALTEQEIRGDSPTGGDKPPTGGVASGSRLFLTQTTRETAFPANPVHSDYSGITQKTCIFHSLWLLAHNFQKYHTN